MTCRRAAGENVESAIRQAKQAAGEKDVVICTTSILQLCLKARLVDEARPNTRILAHLAV